MSYTIAPLVHRLRRRLGLARELPQAAAEILVVAPEEQATRGPARYLPHQLDRVRALQEETTRELEWSRISSGPVVHAATIAYRLDDARLVGGVVYASGTRVAQSYGPERLAPDRLACRIEECSLPSTMTGNRYFAHFVLDDAPTAALARDFAPPYLTRFEGQARWHHAARYLELFDLVLPELASARIGRAWVFQDYGWNAHRRRRLEALRERVRSRPGLRSGHGVFIRRRGGGVPRRMTNEPALEERLAGHGFEIVDPTSTPVDEIVARTRDAAIVCSVEGSGLAHGVLAMAPGASLLAIQPPYRFNNLFKDYADALGMTYSFVVGEGTPDAFTVDIDDVLRTIDLAR